jgi:hypothetical protein
LPFFMPLTLNTASLNLASNLSSRTMFILPILLTIISLRLSLHIRLSLYLYKHITINSCVDMQI